MSISFRIPDPSTGIDLETVFSGTIKPDQLSEYMEQVMSLHDSWQGKRALLTFTGSTSISGFNYAAINRLATYTRTFNDPLTGSRTAVVAERPLIYGLIRMYIALRDPPYEFQVFRHQDAARRWLEAP